MRRIDTASRAVDLFGSGKHGFKDGNPLTGDPATTLTADMFNHLQEEIARVIEAGGVALDGTNYGQMAAVLGLATRSYGPNGYQKLPGGLIIQWGTATTNASGTVTVTHPIAFPTAIRSFVCSCNGGSVTIAVAYGNGAATTVYTYNSSTTAGQLTSFSWIALGN